MFPWQLPPFQPSPTCFQYVSDFSVKNVKQGYKFIRLLDHVHEVLLANIAMECQKAARKAFNIGKVWNPVCWQGNKSVKLALWNTFIKILLQRMKHFWCKMVEISSFHHIWSKFCRVYGVITRLICIFLKINYFWNEKRYLLSYIFTIISPFKKKYLIIFSLGHFQWMI